MSIVLGLDPSLASFGWAMVDVTARKLIESGTIKTPKKRSRGEQLAMIRLALIDAATDNGVFGSVAYEAGIVWRGGSASLAVAEARGVALATLFGYPSIAVNIKTAKMLVASNGNATKEDVRHAVKVALGMTRLLPEDEADAAAVALAAGGYAVARAKRGKGTRAR